jgi:predicted small metal-binding protein
MSKVLRCADVGMNCSFEARGETEEEILKQAAPHAKEVHQLESIPPEVLQKIRQAIRDENPR